MDFKRYNIGRARRFVAGNIWCAQKQNQGKLPCLRCRGRGTLSNHGVGARRGCPDCQGSGHGDKNLWKIWYKLWIYLQVTGKGVDDALFHC